MIDWEKPRVDDCSYDLSCFLSEPAELWCSAYVLNAAEREAFIEDYASLSGKDAALLRKKICIREPMVSLHWILWGATKLCDLKEKLTSPELLGAHEEKIFRYERIARVELIEKILDSL
jgi:thiamine kinase-like enzyme